eukprot:scaffold7675_cov33-Prasinocladus_malaysianus.AAC.2
MTSHPATVGEELKRTDVDATALLRHMISIDVRLYGSENFTCRATAARRAASTPRRSPRCSSLGSFCSRSSASLTALAAAARGPSTR